MWKVLITQNFPNRRPMFSSTLRALATASRVQCIAMVLCTWRVDVAAPGHRHFSNPLRHRAGDVVCIVEIVTEPALGCTVIGPFDVANPIGHSFGIERTRLDLWI